MTLAELVPLTYERYRGKNTNVPQPGSDKYNYIRDTANQKQRSWARDPNHDWISRYELRTVGTLSIGNQTIDLDEDVLRIGDYIELVSPDGNKVYRSVVSPLARTQYQQGVYQTGKPITLTFIETIDDSLAGYTVNVPVSTMPDDLVNPTDEVSVDDPDWLAYATASELARNDPARQDQFGNLSGLANDLYAQMVVNNQTNGYLQPNGAAYNMPQMGSLY